MLLTLSRTLKIAAVAGLVGAGLAATGATTSASADTIRTTCYGDDCYRQQCNDFGYDCVNIGYYDEHAYRPYRSHYVCDDDGDCRWVRIYDRDYDHYYDHDYDHDDGY